MNGSEHAVLTWSVWGDRHIADAGVWRAVVRHFRFAGDWLAILPNNQQHEFLTLDAAKKWVESAYYA